MGRPSEFSQDMADQICERIADGESLRQICESEGFPSKSAVFRWLGVNTVFRDQYARAHEEQADTYADEIIAIADDSANDYGFKEGEDASGASAKPVFLAENVQRSKLRVDARKWKASKLNAKKYGDKITNEMTGADGAPLNFSCTINLVRPNGASGQG